MREQWTDKDRNLVNLIRETSSVAFKPPTNKDNYWPALRLTRVSNRIEVRPQCQVDGSVLQLYSTQYAVRSAFIAITISFCHFWLTFRFYHGGRLSCMATRHF